jgi:hypothetical protein
MNRFESFLVGLASGIAFLYLVMHFTIIRANDGFHWIPKVSAKLDVPYEDVRDFKAEHWQRRPALSMSILRAKKGYLIDERANRQIQQTTSLMMNQARAVNAQQAGRVPQASSSLFAGSASSNR